MATKTGTEKIKNVAMLLVGFVLAMFVLAIPARTTPGQEASTAHMENVKVKQGDNLSMDLTLDKASNLAGSIVVKISPDGTPDKEINLGCGLEAGRTKCAASTRIPLDGKLGKWTISQIRFAPITGEPKLLTEHGDSSFEVTAHGEIVLPDSATVSDLK
jgi:hypothetical protein